MKKIISTLFALALVSSAFASPVMTESSSESSSASQVEMSDTETSECVLANSTDTYTHKFKGGVEAIVIVSGDGDTDLDLYIYDEDGNLVDYDIDEIDTMVCRWTPRRTATYTIKIKNLGSIRNYYTIWTN